MSDADPTARDPEQALLGAFRAALSAPRYAQLLRDAGLDPGSVRSAADFSRQVPILRKAQWFDPAIPFADLCRDGRLGPVRSFMISSGCSGLSAFGVATAEELADTEAGVDGALDASFGTAGTPSLLINAFAMGIHVPTRSPLAETGPRSDLVIKVLERFGPEFAQTVILADPHVLKRIVDEGNEAGLDWAARNVSFVAGQDWLPETLRTYIHTETGIADDGHRALLGTMGLTELGLNLFLETRDLVRLRRAAVADPTLRAAVFPGQGAAVPSLFHFDPRRFHVEGIPHPAGRELAVTCLSGARRMPMVRYATGDLGDTLHPAELAAALLGLERGELMPGLPLPCAWVAGRARWLEAAGARWRAEELRHGLYTDPRVARAVTGHFWIEDAGSGRAAVQLRRGQTPSTALRRAAEAALFSIAGPALPTEVYHYEDYPFARDLDYERKFRHGP